MAHDFTTTRMVEFADTDMAGVVHFHQFFRYMEETEHAFFRSLGLSVVSQDGGQTISWPRSSVSCRFRAPVRFEDELTVQMRVSRKTRSSLTYDFVFVKDRTEVARGQVTTVCCAVGPGGDLRSIPIPEFISQAIEEAPEP